MLAVFDGSTPATEEDRELAQLCAGRPAIALVNKNDLEQRFDETILDGKFFRMLRISAGQGGGISELEQAVRELLGVANLDPGAPCLVSQRQLAAAVAARDALQEAAQALDGGFGLDAVSVCVDDALAALCRLTGEDASESVIEEVFSKFCVGK